MGFELETQSVVTALIFLGLLSAELLLPFYSQFSKNLFSKLRHDFINLLLGAFNAVVLAVVFGAAFVGLEIWADSLSFGLLRVTTLPDWLEFSLSFLLLDCWMYVWHRLNHEVPFFWRFHRVHHSERELDASSGVRFHLGEVVLSALARMIVIPLLGISLFQLAIYEAVFLPLVLFHHSNVKLSKRIESLVLKLVVSPNMHRVHHSRLVKETNSNYGSVLPYWDRIFGTYRFHEDPEKIKIGLDEFLDDKCHTLLGLAKTPFIEPDKIE